MHGYCGQDGEGLMGARRWPTDPTFRKFAALIADGVMFARWRGMRISAQSPVTGGCCCPEGGAALMRGSTCTYPTFVEFGFVFGLPFEDMAWAFAQGFDDAQVSLPRKRLDRAAYRLGREYRRRFVDGAPPEAEAVSRG